MTANRETSPAPGERAHPALALANSRRNAPGGVVDALDSATSLQAWLRGRGFESERTCEPGDVTAFVELRQAVRELVTARVEARAPDGSAVSLVNRVAAGAPTAPRLEWGADGPRLTQNRLGGRGLALVSAVIAVDAMALVAHAEDGELRACAAPGCVRLLLRDHPRRQWCSTRCGDRVRAGRYYHRHRAPSEDES